MFTPAPPPAHPPAIVIAYVSPENLSEPPDSEVPNLKIGYYSSADRDCTTFEPIALGDGEDEDDNDDDDCVEDSSCSLVNLTCDEDPVVVSTKKTFGGNKTARLHAELEADLGRDDCGWFARNGERTEMTHSEDDPSPRLVTDLKLCNRS